MVYWLNSDGYKLFVPRNHYFVLQYENVSNESAVIIITDKVKQFLPYTDCRQRPKCTRGVQRDTDSVQTISLG